MRRKQLDRIIKESMAGVGADAPPPAPPPVDPVAAMYAGRSRGRGGDMEVGNIVPDPGQPRKTFDPDELARLAESLKAHGQLQPVLLRWDAALAKWVVVDGERRYRAALLAGLPKLSAVFEEGGGAADAAPEKQLVANCLRVDLKPVEKATAFQALMRAKGWSGKELAARLRLAPSAVSQALALLGLPPDVRQKVAAGDLAPSVAVEVAKLNDPREQRAMVEEVVSAKLTREQATKRVRQRQSNSTVESRGRRPAKRPLVETYRAANGVKIETRCARRHTDADVVAALEEYAAERRGREKEAA